MSRIPTEVRQTLSTISTIPKLQEQQRTLDRTAKAMETFTPMFNYFREVRIRQEPIFPSNHEELMAICRKTIFDTVPVKLRKSIRDNATRYVDSLFSNNCDFSKLAKAEASLRKIFLLCLSAAAARYKVRVRLPDWNAMIAAEQAKLDQIESEWREVIAINS